jgi:UDP-N-acetylmuramyl pentapeptide phosphotransferase/UDP-N-acetylglucosamine-1-phosphate transferase
MKPISRFYNLYDYPDFKRKLHKAPVPLLGGLFLQINLFVIFFLNFFLEKLLDENFLLFSKSLALFIFTFLFYLLGFVDDKYRVRANIKLLLMIFLLTLFLIFDHSFLLNNLIFTFYDKKIFLGGYSYFVTILCFLLFINAFNMLDGLNGQAVSYTIFILIIFIFKGVSANLSILLILTSLFFLYLNFKNKTYLGDSGSLVLGFILSYLFLKSYNLNNSFGADEIFLIMCIPGYELLRLAIKRIVHKKHPFTGDNDHIHHLMIRNYNFIKSYFVIQLLLIAPYIANLILKKFYTSLAFSLLIYCLAIYYFSKKNE